MSLSHEADAIMIRTLATEDSDALRRLAELDGARIPSGAVLGAEQGGSLVAAIEPATGLLVADPFRPTAAAVEILRTRAQQLNGAGPGHDGRGRRRRARAVGALAGSPPGAGGRL